MSRETIFLPGCKIRTISVLLRHIREGRWIYWKQRPKHPTILLGMTLRTLDQATKHGILRLAKRRLET